MSQAQPMPPLRRRVRRPSVRRGQYVLSSPRPQAVLRPLRQPIWDTELGEANTSYTQILFFQRPQGQTTGVTTTITKSKLHTNLMTSGTLGVPLEFDLYGFRISYWLYQSTQANYDVAATMSNINAIAYHLNADGVFVFLFGTQRPWLEIPVRKVPSGVGPWAFSSNTTDNEEAQAIQNGLPTVGNFYNFTVRRRPLRIRSAENFGARIEFPTVAFIPTANVLIQVELVGVLYTAL